MREQLQNLYLFRGLDPELLDTISTISTLRRFDEAGEIFHQGAEAKSFFVIHHGMVQIDQELADGTRVEVATLSTGSHFGEIPFLDRHRRSGTATAVKESDIIEVDYAGLEKLLDETPALALHVYRELARFLSSRLRLTTLDLTYSKAENLRHF